MKPIYPQTLREKLLRIIANELDVIPELLDTIPAKERIQIFPAFCELYAALADTNPAPPDSLPPWYISEKEHENMFKIRENEP